MNAESRTRPAIRIPSPLIAPQLPSHDRSRRMRWRALWLLSSCLAAASLPARADSVVARFALNSSAQGVAIQFDVAPVAAGVTITGPLLENAPPHIVDSNLLGSGATRFLVYSTTNALLNPAGVVSVTLGVTSPSLFTDGMLRIENVIVTGADGQAVAGQPNAKPVVISRSPNQYRSCLLGASVPLSVQAIDPDGSVTSVSFRLNGISQGLANARPFSFIWTPSVAGLYSFDAEVLGGGDSATSVPVDLRAYNAADISSFAGFAGIHFGTDAGNPAIAGPAAIPFGNGLQNLLAYYLGLNPWNPDLSSLPQLTRDQSGNLIFSFRRSASATGVDYAIINTPTLNPATWLELTGLPVTTINLGNGFQEMAITVPSTGTEQFFRLQVTKTAP